MAAWTERGKQRDDDPYHAWAYHTSQADTGGDAQSDKLCPVVIQLKSDNGATDGLVKALLSLLAAIAPKDEFASIIKQMERPELSEAIPDRELIPSEGPLADALPEFTFMDNEKAHLVESVRMHTTKDIVHRELEDRDLYWQIFMLYAPEKALFPKRLKPELWDNKLFAIRYVGQAVRNRAKQESLKSVDASRRTSKTRFLTIIDDSMAFLNEAFVLENAKTCFEHIWFQDRDRSGASDGIGGPRLTKEDVEAYLAEIRKSDGPSEREMYESVLDGHSAGGAPLQFKLIDFTSAHHQALAFSESHGTHVAATAVKAFVAKGGKIQELGLSAITLPTDVTQDTSGAALGSYLIAALRQAMLWNDELHTSDSEDEYPLVMSCSYGFLAGAKDGRDALSSIISDILLSRNMLGRPTAFVVPMGNQYNTRSVASKTLAPGETLNFDWVLEPDDRTENFLELYARNTGAKLRLKVSAPYGHDPLDVPFDGGKSESSGEMRTEVRQVLLSKNNKQIGEWAEWVPGPIWPNRPPDRSRWDLRGALCLGQTASLEQPEDVMPSGRWAVEITNTSSVEVDVLAMVQRDDAPGTYPQLARQSFLDHPNAHEYGDQSTDYASANWDQLKASGCPLTHKNTASVLASIDSPYLFAVGAGQGADGDLEGYPVEASRYSGAGPRTDEFDGPEYSEMSDRSENFPGIFGAGTFSGQDVLMNGSSVAAPQLAGYLAATYKNSDDLAELKEMIHQEDQPPFANPKSGKFGHVLTEN